MTGFASVSRDDGGQAVSVTAKSVNHRFLDVQVKASSSLASFEPRVKAIAQQRLTRGRLEVSLAIAMAGGPSVQATLNEAVLASVVQAIERARAKGLVHGELTAGDILRVPQVLEIRHDADATVLPETAIALLETVLGETIDALAVMRMTEGGFLARDLDARLATLEDLVDQVEAESRAGQLTLEARLRDRIESLPHDVRGEPTALAQEIVRVVARSDIDEELERFRGHVAHWRGLVSGPEPCGRKLDFLVQEINREINTMGSKAEGRRVPELVVTAKAELERIKEQVQNVE